ncbi:MAG: hypothetical protein ACI4XA_06480 [Oscillospiraceae bacterium]
MSEFAEEPQNIPDGGELTAVTRERGSRNVPAFLKTEWFVMICLYAGTLLLHILMTLCTTIFNLTPDEYSVTAVAAYFNGLDWRSTVSTGGYYGYFQSLFYIPVFGITDDPYLRYRLMLVINGILMSFAPVIVYYLSRKAFEVKKAASIVFALICGLYPCYMLLTKYTWNETMCNLLPWVFALLMYKSIDCKSTVRKQIFSVLGGLTLVAAYATHGRMLALLAAGAVLELVVFFTMKKKRIFCLTGFYAAIVVGFIGDKFMKNFIQSALWRIDEGKTPTNTIERMFTRIFSTGDSGLSVSEGVSLEKFFDTLIGHLFYFISSTWGFGAICIVAVIVGIVLYYKRRNRQTVLTESGEADPKSGPYLDDNHAVFLWFTLLVMGAIFVVSVAFKATSSLYAERADTVIYGRYTEVMYPVALLAGLLVIYRGRFGMGQSFAALCTGAAINLLTMLRVVPVVVGGERFVSAMIMGLAPMRYGELMKDMLTQQTFIKIIISTTTMLFVWVIIKLIRLKDKKIHWFYSLPLAGLLLYSNIYLYTSYTIPQSRNSAFGAKYMSDAIDLLEDDFDSVTCFNLARERYVKAQFLYDDLDVEVVTSYSKLKTIVDKGGLPDIILAGKEENLDMWFDGIHRIGDINRTIHVYACTEKAVQWALDKGLSVSEGGGTVTYTAADVPATTHAVRNGFDEETADPDRSNGEGVTLTLPNGSAVYTNYTTLYKAGAYYFTVYGEGVGRGKITLTTDKGEKTLDYTVLEQSDNVLRITAIIKEKKENVRFKLSNTGTEPITVTSLTVSNKKEQ